MKYRLNLGWEDDPASNIGGFDLNLKFPNLTTPPSKVTTSVTDTWIAVEQSQPACNASYDHGTRRLSAEFLRTDETGQTGHGTILNIRLVRPGGFASSEASMFIDGGVVMVENINLRTATGSLLPAPFPLASESTIQAAAWDLEAYPQPCKGELTVRVRDASDRLLTLTAIDGRLMLAQPAASLQTISLNGIPPATYILRLEGKGETFQRTVILR